jgi:hypothetical protein
MPHLKFTRDRRGYENTFLMHALRGRGRGGQQVLYWFRSPPHVKVGRAAIDEDAIRELQAQYPDIDFDWDRILEAKPPAAEPDDQTRGRGRFRERRRDPQRAREQREAAVDPEEAAVEPPRRVPLATDDAFTPNALSSGEMEPQEEASASPAGGDLADGELSVSAVERALGSQGLSRVRARYAEVLARIHGAPIDAEAQARLVDLAEQLNPDTWVTSAQVQEGVRRFEGVLAEISTVVGAPRKRTRRGGRRTRRRRGENGMGQERSVASPEPEPADAASDDGDIPG